MTNQAACIGIDIGGSHMEAAAVSADGRVLGDTAQGSSHQNEAAAVITSAVIKLVSEVRQHQPVPVKAAGVALPGPFDYQQGISQMEHKFAGLYGINIKQPLETGLGLPVRLLNDAAAFGLGVSARDWPAEPRLAAFVIGTGIGGVFLAHGSLVTDGVPGPSEIRNIPYRDGTLEDYLSTAGFLRAYHNRGGNPELSVKQVAQAARGGEPAAVAAVAEFARDLGAGLALACGQWQATRIVLGGKISNDLDLYLPQTQPAFEQAAGYLPQLSLARPHAAIIGAARYAATPPAP